MLAGLPDTAGMLLAQQSSILLIQFPAWAFLTFLQSTNLGRHLYGSCIGHVECVWGVALCSRGR